jgi:hypothetical protein
MDPEVAVGFVFSFLLFVVVPVVFMLLHHQRKMAELIHSKSSELPPTPAQATDPILLQELMRLRDAMTQQTIAIDNLASSQRALEAKIGETEDLRQRLR